jgi:hypothetical protein
MDLRKAAEMTTRLGAESFVLHAAMAALIRHLAQKDPAAMATVLRELGAIEHLAKQADTRSATAARDLMDMLTQSGIADGT